LDLGGGSWACVSWNRRGGDDDFDRDEPTGAVRGPRQRLARANRRFVNCANIAGVPTPGVRRSTGSRRVQHKGMKTDLSVFAEISHELLIVGWLVDVDRGLVRRRRDGQVLVGCTDLAGWAFRRQAQRLGAGFKRHFGFADSSGTGVVCGRNRGGIDPFLPFELAAGQVAEVHSSKGGATNGNGSCLKRRARRGIYDQWARAIDVRFVVHRDLAGIRKALSILEGSRDHAIARMRGGREHVREVGPSGLGVASATYRAV
jgi:hypothetical protein